MQTYRWATLGCGVIANELAQALAKKGQKLYSVSNRTHSKAVAFAEKYGIEKVYEHLEDVFEDENVDIIYISTPHNTHIEYLRKALAAKKHVLCEKSITLNSDELEEAIALAKENGVVLAEAMTIYHMPIYKTLREKINAGDLGELRLLQMNFGSYKDYDMTNRFFNRNLAGGAMLDIGVYALSFVRWFMSSAPDQVVSQVKYAPTGVDEQASILLKNPEEEMASVILSMHAKQPKRGTIAFDKGYVEIYEYPRAEKAVITYTETGKTETLEDGCPADALSYEVADMENAVAMAEIQKLNNSVSLPESAEKIKKSEPIVDSENIESTKKITEDTVSKNITGNKNTSQENGMYLEYTRDVMQIMTDIRKQWHMTYPEEE